MELSNFVHNSASRLAITALIVSSLNPMAVAASQPESAKGARAASQVRQAAAQAKWAQAMRKIRRPATGCAVANFPIVAWKNVACGVAPNFPYVPRTGHGNPFTVGDNSGDFTPRTNPRTTSADGSFRSNTSGLTETGQSGAPPGTSQTDAYSLQLNTNRISPSSGCTAGSGPNCEGWEQFIYTNNDSTHETFIQYWLIAFNTTCPTGWNSYPYPGPTDISCWRNSPSSPLAADQPVSNLSNMVLTGLATATSDGVTINSGAGMATVTGLNAVGLAGGWTDTEFNIFGDANRYQAIFGANTTLTVRTLVHNGTTVAPTCLLTSFTGETNNLTLTGMSAAGPLPSPGVEFDESNAPGTTAACVGASGVGDTHLRTFTGLLYDFQATGDFTLAESGGFEAQARQVSGAPVWPDASVNQAVAARLGKFDVAICSADRPDVMVGGESRSLNDGQIIELGDGSGIRRVGDVIVLVDPQGNSLRAELLGSHIDATVGLGRWPTKVRGLLVSSGRANSVLRGRDGVAYAAPYAFGAFYGKYGESWRVPAGRSLLRACGPAKENGRPKRPLTVRNLNPELARKARAVCVAAGVINKALLDACTLDVAVLGEKKAARVFTTLRPPTALGPIS